MQPNDLIAKKPVSEMSPIERRQCREIARMLVQDWQDKYALAEILGVSERTARDRISTIAKRMPVISTSDSKGYKIARTMADLELAKQAARELGSRMNELNSRKEVLDNFISEMEGREGGTI